jgi:hypothetical protein
VPVHGLRLGRSYGRRVPVRARAASAAALLAVAGGLWAAGGNWAFAGICWGLALLAAGGTR